MENRFPDFFVAGAAKSGTTALWEMLRQHPQVFMVDKLKHKELSYFSKTYSYGIKSETEYLSFFKNAKDNQFIGEACNTYLTSPESAELIKSSVPNARIIIILRNPVDRAYSLYNWMCSHGFEWIGSFKRALEWEKKRMVNKDFVTKNPQYFHNYLYFESGLYHAQVERYFEEFGRENCYICLYDELRKNPMDLFSKICDFLRIDADFRPKIFETNIGKSVRFVPLQYFARTKLPSLLIKTGIHNQYSSRYKLVTRLRSAIFSLNTRESYRPVDNKTYRQLIIRYKSDILKTEKLTGLNLKEWLYYEKFNG